MTYLDYEYAYLVVFVALVLFLRLRRQHSGSTFTTGRIIRTPLIYILLTLLLLASTPTLDAILITITALLLGMLLGSKLGSRSSVFKEGEKIKYKRSNEIFAIWIIAFVIRLALDFSHPLNTSLDFQVTSGNLYYIYVAADALLAFSAGMLAEEAMHLFKKYKGLDSSNPKASEPPHNKQVE